MSETSIPSATQRGLTQSRRPNRWPARLLALGFGLVVFCVIPELVVRWLNPPLQAFRTIIFGDKESSPKLFITDARLGWALRPGANLRFLGRRAHVDDQGFRGDGIVPGKRVILCLGDSSTFGWGVGQTESFPARLQHLLDNDSLTRGRWQVINGGVPAYSSWQIRVKAEQLVPHLRPDYLVVCTGNNEAWPVERSDKSVYGTKSPLNLAIVGLLSQSKFLVWLFERFAPSQSKPYRAPPARLAVPRVSIDEMVGNLKAMANLVTEYGGRLLVISPTVNRYHPPIERELLRFADSEDHRAAPDAPPSTEALAILRRWHDDQARVSKLLDDGDHDGALVEAQLLLAQHAGDFSYQWLHGMALAASGKLDPAEAILEQAFEEHPFPDRCKRSYRLAIERTTHALGVPYIDANALFLDHARPGLPLGYYLDWCHPTAKGHDLIAQALFDQVARILREHAPVPTGR